MVEDEALVALDIAAQLRRAGHEVLGPHGDAKTAIDAIALDPPDVAVLDFGLRDGRTSEPIAEVLAERGIPFVFLTGFAATALLGRNRFADRPRLSKPCSILALDRTIRELAG